jgi:hypothetical protein
MSTRDAPELTRGQKQLRELRRQEEERNRIEFFRSQLEQSAPPSPPSPPTPPSGVARSPTGVIRGSSAVPLEAGLNQQPPGVSSVTRDLVLGEKGPGEVRREQQREDALTRTLRRSVFDVGPPGSPQQQSLEQERKEALAFVLEKIDFVSAIYGAGLRETAENIVTGVKDPFDKPEVKDLLFLSPLTRGASLLSEKSLIGGFTDIQHLPERIAEKARVQQQQPWWARLPEYMTPELFPALIKAGGLALTKLGARKFAKQAGIESVEAVAKPTILETPEAAAISAKQRFIDTIAGEEARLGRQLSVEEIGEVARSVGGETRLPPSAALAPPPAVVPNEAVQLADKWQAAKARNSARATKDIDGLKAKGYDVSEADDALTEYKNTVRGDFDSAEDFTKARSEAWDNFVGALDDVEDLEGAVPTVLPAARAAAEVTEVAPVLPPPEPMGPPPTPPKTDTVLRMWDEPIRPPKIPLKARFTAAYVKLQENMLDRFAWGNRESGIARKEYKEATGNPLPPDIDFEVQAAFLGSSDSAGLQNFADTQRRAMEVLGPDINPDLVEKYLHLQHGISTVEQKGAQRLISGGVEGIEDAKQRLADMARELGPEKFARLEASAGEWRGLVQRNLARDVDEGFITAELAAQLEEMYPWYMPIRYQELLLERMSGTGSRISVTNNDLRRLTDVGLDIDVQRPTASLLQQTMYSEMRIQRNRTAKALIEDMLLDPALKGEIKRVRGVRPVAEVEGEVIFRRPPGEIPSTISYMENGKRVVWKVPPEAEAMAKRMGDSPLGDLNVLLRGVQTPFRHAFVTYQPAFMAAQASFDTATVLITRGVMPWDTGWAFLANMKGLFKYDAKMSEIIRSGGSVTGWHGRSAQELANNYAKTGRVILYTPLTVKKALTKPWELIRDIGHAIELSPRRAVYERAIRKGQTPAEAALAFRRATVDFQRIGQSMRLANALYLFLNPAVQGSLLPFRALRDVKAARYGIAGLLGYTFALYAWNRQFPEYANVPLHDKYGGGLIMLPSEEYDQRGEKMPHYIKMPAMLRELAAFTSVPTYLLGKMDDLSPESTGQFLNAMVRQLNPFSQIIGGIEVKAVPVPTTLGTLLTEINLNYDSFRGRPIVPQELEGLPPEQQFNARTSEISKRLGEFLGWSPMKIDHMLRQGIAWEIFGALDAGLRAIDNDEDPYIVALAERLRDIQDDTPPGEIALTRRKFLGNLTATDRKAVLEEERKPQPRIPIADSVMSRFYRKGSGNLYEAGQAAAQKATGISSKQTRAAGRLLGLQMDKLQLNQEQSDADLASGKISATQWRNARENRGKLYQGALGVIQTIMPLAGQVAPASDWAAYKEHVATVAGTMPDRRSQGDLLYSAWLTISPMEISPQIFDWPAYYDRRDDFVASLSSDDAELLREVRETSMTPKEREFQTDLETLRPYWAQVDLVIQRLHPADRRTYEGYKLMSRKRRSEFTTVLFGDSLEVAANKEKNRKIINAVDKQISDHLRVARFSGGQFSWANSVRRALIKWEMNNSMELMQVQSVIEGIGGTP